MRSNERMIFLGVAIVALTVGFYLLVIGPKRDKASELKDQVNQLHASISAAEQQADYGEQARQEFPKYYGRMVVLGKAVPAESDTASLLVQLNSLSDRSKVDLRSIALSEGGSAESGSGTSTSAATTPTSPSTSPTAPTGAAEAAASTASTANSATPTPTTGSSTGAPVPATEAAAAALPIGSVVGPAGLPTLPYTLSLQGGYFDVSSLIGRIDGLVRPVDSAAKLSPDGRLLTVNGFSIQLNGTGPSPQLKANFVVTAYSSGQQGLTAGASSTGPAPVSPNPGETDVQPASAVVPK